MSEEENTYDLTARQKRPDGRIRRRESRYQLDDGRQYTTDQQHQLNRAFAITFMSTEAGRLVFDYLKSISTNRVLGRGSEPHEITYHEGARWLMGIIDQRVKDGEDKKP